MDISKWLCILFFVLLHESSCTERNTLELRPEKINEVKIESHPYHVYIEGENVCSGSIIGKSWILTAANCNFTVATTTVFAGSNIRGKGKRLKIKSAIKMPLYHKKFRAPVYNFMLLELTVPLVYDVTIHSIEMGKECDVITGDGGYVTGFFHESVIGMTLRLFRLTIIEFSQCRVYWHSTLHECTEICVSQPGAGKNDWRGDGGAGFVVKGKLVGIASRASKKIGTPVIFASVPKVRLWIESVTGIA